VKKKGQRIVKHGKLRNGSSLCCTRRVCERGGGSAACMRGGGSAACMRGGGSAACMSWRMCVVSSSNAKSYIKYTALAIIQLDMHK